MYHLGSTLEHSRVPCFGIHFLYSILHRRRWEVPTAQMFLPVWKHSWSWDILLLNAVARSGWTTRSSQVRVLVCVSWALALKDFSNGQKQKLGLKLWEMALLWRFSPSCCFPGLPASSLICSQSVLLSSFHLFLQQSQLDEDTAWWRETPEREYSQGYLCSTIF